MKRLKQTILAGSLLFAAGLLSPVHLYAMPAIVEYCDGAACFPTPTGAGASGCGARGHNFAFNIPRNSFYRVFCTNVYEDQPDRAIEVFGVATNTWCPAGYSLDVPSQSCLLSPGGVSQSANNGHSCSTAGNPITLGTANKFQREEDIVSRVLPLTRYYNSQNNIDNRVFGNHWSHSYSSRLHFIADSLSVGVLLVRPDGKAIEFDNSNGDWVAVTAPTLELSMQFDGAGELTGWTLVIDGQTTESYNEIGLLTQIIRQGQPTLTLSYDSGDQLSQVTATTGDSLTFAYTTVFTIGYQITSVTHSDGSQWTYGYDVDANLVAVTAPGTTTAKTYQYQTISPASGGAAINALTGITDENGATFATWTYDAEVRAISSQHAGGFDNVTINNSFLNDPVNPRSTVTNALGKQTTYYYTTINGVRKITQVEGHASANCAAANQAYTYDANGFMASSTDWQGNVTTYVHNDRGQELSRTEASGTPQARTITTEWHPDFNLPTRIVEPERETLMTYDPNGRLLSRQVLPVTP